MGYPSVDFAEISEVLSLSDSDSCRTVKLTAESDKILVMCNVIMYYDKIHLARSQGIKVILVVVMCDDSDGTIVVLCKPLHQFITESCFKSPGTQHVISKVYGTNKLLSFKDISINSSADGPVPFAERNDQQEKDRNAYIS